MNNRDSEIRNSRRLANRDTDASKQDNNNTREDADHLWDKTFANNEDRNADGYLSRTQRRRQTEHNSMITTILVVAIIVLASVPLVFWLNHRESFNHPSQQRTERVASSHSKKTSSKKKAVAKAKPKSKKASHKKKSNNKSVAKQQSASSASQSQNSGNTTSNSTQSSSTRTVTVTQGQGLYRVATNNGMTVSELEKLNGLTPGSELHPGQQLKVK